MTRMVSHARCAVVESTATVLVQNYADSRIKRGSWWKCCSGWHGDLCALFVKLITEPAWGKGTGPHKKNWPLWAGLWPWFFLMFRSLCAPPPNTLWLSYLLDSGTSIDTEHHAGLSAIVEPVVTMRRCAILMWYMLWPSATHRTVLLVHTLFIKYSLSLSVTLLNYDYLCRQPLLELGFYLHFSVCFSLRYHKNRRRWVT